MVERIPAGDVVYQESAGCATVVRASDGTEGFLSGLQQQVKKSLKDYI